MKVELLELMENLVHPRKGLVLILLKQTQNFVLVCLLKLIIVICLLIEKKSLNLKPTKKMCTFQFNFALEVYLMDLVLLSLEKYF